MNMILKFAERLTLCMEDSDANAEKLSRELNHNLYDFYHWKSGKGKFMPSVKNLIMLADFFSCSLEYLVGISDVNELPNPKKDLPPLGERISELTKRSGKPLTQIAEEAGFSSTTVLYDWKNGKKTPRIDSLAALSRVLGCSVDELVGRE